MKPVSQIIALVKDPKKVEEIFNNIIRDYDYKIEGVQKITDMSCVSSISLNNAISFKTYDTTLKKDFDEDGFDEDIDIDEDKDEIWNGSY